MKFSKQALFNTKWGKFNFVCCCTEGGLEHSILWIGNIENSPPPLVRIQSSCLTSTALGGIICDCADQLTMSFEMIADEGRGAVIYLDQEGRGHGLFQKLETMHEMNRGLDTVDAFLTRGLAADVRDFSDIAPIMGHVKMAKKIRPITNNPDKLKVLNAHGYTYADRIPIRAPERPEIKEYLMAKKNKMGHLIEDV